MGIVHFMIILHISFDLAMNCVIAWIVKWIVDERKLHKVWEVKPMKFDVEMPRVGTKIEFQSRFSRTEHELWSDQSYSDTQISGLANIFSFYKIGQNEKVTDRNDKFQLFQPRMVQSVLGSTMVSSV